MVKVSLRLSGNGYAEALLFDHLMLEGSGKRFGRARLAELFIAAGLQREGRRFGDLESLVPSLVGTLAAC